MAALLATHLTHFVVKEIPLKDPSIFVWSDSQIVLHWVNSRKQLPTSVCHLITEIQSLATTNSQVEILLHPAEPSRLVCKGNHHRGTDVIHIMAAWTSMTHYT